MDLYDKIEKIVSSTLYKQIVKDSYGGVCYMKSPSDYDEKEKLELIDLWASMTDAQKQGCNGIIKGAFNFIQGK